jgi:hypothetical protein
MGLLLCILGLGCFLLILVLAGRICDKMGWLLGWLVLLLIPLVGLLFLLVLVWRALPEAGRSRWLTLLMIVPLANLLLLVFLAFSRWPAPVETHRAPEILLPLARLRAPRGMRPMLLRVLVNIGAWIAGLLALAVVAGLYALLTLLGITLLSFLAGIAIAILVLLAFGWTLTVILYLPVEIEFTEHDA